MPRQPVNMRTSDRQRVRLQANQATALSEQVAAKHNHLLSAMEKLDHRLRLVEFERDMLESVLVEHLRTPWWKRRRRALIVALASIEDTCFERLQQYVASMYLGRFFQRFWSGILEKRAEPFEPQEATAS